MPQPLPPLVAEDHVCPECRLAYSEVSVEHALRTVASIAAAVRAAVDAVPVERLRERPGTGSWSVLEYVCHLRDVYATYTLRLHRARTEQRPALEPMLNDLRARRFRYNDWDVDAAMTELGWTSAGFCDEVRSTQPTDWSRTVTRLSGEERSARWLVRQAMHEGVHHLRDIRRVGGLLG